MPRMWSAGARGAPETLSIARSRRRARRRLRRLRFRRLRTFSSRRARSARSARVDVVAGSWEHDAHVL
eukprot:12315109-Alexandrium_andersonii.AAC.1